MIPGQFLAVIGLKWVTLVAALPKRRWVGRLSELKVLLGFELVYGGRTSGRPWLGWFSR
jgi:hypothetical protein